MTFARSYNASLFFRSPIIIIIDAIRIYQCECARGGRRLEISECVFCYGAATSARSYIMAFGNQQRSQLYMRDA